MEVKCPNCDSVEYTSKNWEGDLESPCDLRLYCICDDCHKEFVIYCDVDVIDILETEHE